MKNTKEQVEIKITKALKKMFDRYEVTVREPQTITHQTYGKQTLVTATVYAVYEAAIKSIFVAHFLDRSDDPREMIGCIHYHQRMIDVDLPFVSDAMIQNKTKYITQASDDYKTCCRIIADAGLYYDLLD